MASFNDLSALSLDLPLREAREDFERLYFRHHLERWSWSVSKVALVAGVDRTHLYRKLRQLELMDRGSLGERR